MKNSALQTANFIKYIDNLIDTFNSICFNEPKIMRQPLQKDSCHWDFLVEADKMLYNLKIHNRTGNQPSCKRMARKHKCFSVII